MISYCTDPRHDVPCPGPCTACEIECDPKYFKHDMGHEYKHVPQGQAQKNEENRILGQITLGDADELTGDILKAIVPDFNTDSVTGNAMYGIVHDVITGRFANK